MQRHTGLRTQVTQQDLIAITGLYLCIDKKKICVTYHILPRQNRKMNLTFTIIAPSTRMFVFADAELTFPLRQTIFTKN